MRWKEGRPNREQWRTQRWATARKHFSSWARRTVEEVVLPNPGTKSTGGSWSHVWDIKPCQRCHQGRNEKKHTSLSLPPMLSSLPSRHPNGQTQPQIRECEKCRSQGSASSLHPIQSRDGEGERNASEQKSQHWHRRRSCASIVTGVSDQEGKLLAESREKIIQMF